MHLQFLMYLKGNFKDFCNMLTIIRAQHIETIQDF